jgi:hypothetical protein
VAPLVIGLERRLEQPRWLSVAVPVGSLVVAFGIMGIVLAATGHAPGATYRRIVEAGFTGHGALSATLISATPILFTGLAAAAAFRMQLFNIGAEAATSARSVRRGSRSGSATTARPRNRSSSSPCVPPPESSARSGRSSPGCCGPSRIRTRSSRR